MNHSPHLAPLVRRFHSDRSGSGDFKYSGTFLKEISSDLVNKTVLATTPARAPAAPASATD